MNKILKMLGLKKCGDCGAYYNTWESFAWEGHFLFNKKHRRWLATQHPKEYGQMMKEGILH
jgi:hypothetical protein